MSVRKLLTSGDVLRLAVDDYKFGTLDPLRLRIERVVEVHDLEDGRWVEVAGVMLNSEARRSNRVRTPWYARRRFAGCSAARRRPHADRSRLAANRVDPFHLCCRCRECRSRSPSRRSV